MSVDTPRIRRPCPRPHWLRHRATTAPVQVEEDGTGRVPDGLGTFPVRVRTSRAAAPTSPVAGEGIGGSATVGAPSAIENAVVDVLPHVGMTRMGSSESTGSGVRDVGENAVGGPCGTHGDGVCVGVLVGMWEERGSWRTGPCATHALRSILFACFASMTPAAHGRGAQ